MLRVATVMLGTRDGYLGIRISAIIKEDSPCFVPLRHRVEYQNYGDGRGMRMRTKREKIKSNREEDNGITGVLPVRVEWAIHF